MSSNATTTSTVAAPVSTTTTTATSAVSDAVSVIHNAVSSQGIDLNGVLTLAADVISTGTSLSASTGADVGTVVSSLLTSQLASSGLNPQSIAVLTSFVSMLVPVVEEEAVSCWSWVTGKSTSATTSSTATKVPVVPTTTTTTTTKVATTS